MTRSSRNWKCNPGGWDSTNIKHRKFTSNNNYDIPELQPTEIEVNQKIQLLSYRHRDDYGKKLRVSICHFFLDDYYFESVWNKPDMGLRRVRRFYATLTPDFSVYANWPLPVQLWNTYRSRWVGKYWQEKGVNVIPTINWSTRESFQWCFIGLPKNSTIAIGVPDIRNEITKCQFIQGFMAMNRTIEPKQIIVYGKLPFKWENCIEQIPDWIRLRNIIRTT